MERKLLGRLGRNGNTAGFPATNIGVSDKTLTQADFQKDNYTDGSPTFTVDNSISVDSEARFGGLDADDSVTLTPGSGVTFYGKGYDLITGTAVIDSTYVGHIKKMAPNLYRLTGAWKSVSAPGCTADPNQAYVANDPASDPNCTEGTSFSNWIGDSSGLSADSSDPQTGTVAVKHTYADAGSSTGLVTSQIAVDNGATYAVSFWAKSSQTTSNGARFGNWQGIASGGPSGLIVVPADDTWREYTYTVVTNSTQIGALFYSSVSTTGTNGDDIFIDNFSVIKQ